MLDPTVSDTFPGSVELQLPKWLRPPIARRVQAHRDAGNIQVGLPLAICIGSPPHTPVPHKDLANITNKKSKKGHF